MSSNDLQLLPQPTQIAGMEPNIDQDSQDGKSHKTDINVGADTLNEKEKEILVQKFDMFKFENRVKDLIKEALGPLTQIQHMNERSVQANENKLLEMDIKTTEAIHAMNKATRGVTSYSDLDTKLANYVAKDEGNKMHTEGEFAFLKNELRTMNDTIRKMDAGILNTQKDIKAVLMQSAKVEQNIQAMARFKEDMERFMMQNIQQMSQSISEKGAAVDRCDQLVKSLEVKCTHLSEAVRNMDASVGTFNTELADMSEFQTSLEEEVRELGFFSTRIQKCENELRNLRMLSEQNVMDTQAALQTAITQRDCEETIYRFNFDMMEKFTYDLTMDEDRRNHYLPDQMRVDVLKYFAELAGKLEKNKFGGALKYKIIKNQKQCEADHYRALLDLPKIASGPKLDEWGGLRVLSAAGKRQEAKLEEFILRKVTMLQDQFDSQQSQHDPEEKHVHFEKKEPKMVTKMMYVPKTEENAGEDMMNKSARMPFRQGESLWTPVVEEQEELVVPAKQSPRQKQSTRTINQGGGAVAVQQRGGVGITARDKNTVVKKLSPEDLMVWGKWSLSKEAIMPEGMQFVNSKHLVDLKDLQTFKDKFTRELEYLIDLKIEEHDEKVVEEADEMKDFLMSHIADTKKELEEKIREVVDKDLVNLDKLCQKRLENLRINFENQIYQVRSEANSVKLDQSDWNAKTTERLNGQARISNNLRTEVQMAQQEQADDLKKTRDLLTNTNRDFAETMRLMNSIVELQYLSQCLEFQDEADKRQMSLWGLNPIEENGLTKLVQPEQSNAKTQQNPLNIDEDCLACGLEKYRPAIKSAFKMACIQYKPTPVHFNKKRYERTSIINIKRQMAEDIITNQIYANKIFVKYMKFKEEPAMRTFKENLHVKLEQFGKQIASDGSDLEHDITNLILNAELRKQIIKNEPNMAYLLQQTGQDHALGQYLNQMNEDQRQLQQIVSPWATATGITTTLDSVDSNKKQQRKTRIQQKSEAYLNSNNGLHLASPDAQQSKGFAVQQQFNQKSKDSRYEASSRVTLAGNWGQESPSLQQTALTAHRVVVNETKFNSSAKIKLIDTKKTDSGSFGSKEIHIKTNQISQRGPGANIDQNELNNISRESSRAPTRQLQTDTGGLEPFRPLDIQSAEDGSAKINISPMQAMHSTPTSTGLDEKSIEEARRNHNLQVWKRENSSLDPAGDNQSSMVHQIIHHPRQNLPIEPRIKQPALKLDPFSKLSKQKLRNQKDWSYSSQSPANINSTSQNQLNLPNFSLNSNLPEIPVIYRSGAISQLQSITRLRQDLNDSQIQNLQEKSSGQIMESPRIKKRGNFSSLDKFAANTGSQNSTMKSSMDRHVFKNCQSTGKIAPNKFENSMLLGSQSLQKPLNQKDKAKNVTEALSQLKLVDKKALADRFKKNNNLMKKKDNMAVITGSPPGNIPNYEQELAIAQISTLTSQQARGHGTGYMYSQRLISNLMSPHNPKHIDAQQLIGAKNIGFSVLESQKSLQDNAQAQHNSQMPQNHTSQHQLYTQNSIEGVQTLGQGSSSNVLMHHGSKQSVFSKLGASGITPKESSSILDKYEEKLVATFSDGSENHPGFKAAYATGQTLVEPVQNASMPILQIHSNISPTAGNNPMVSHVSGNNLQFIDDISHKQSSKYKFQKGQQQEFYGKQLGKQLKPNSLKKGPFAYSNIATTLKQSKNTSAQASQANLDQIEVKEPEIEGEKQSTGFPSAWKNSSKTSKHQTATDFGITNSHITQLKDELHRYQKMKRSGQNYNYEPPTAGIRVGIIGDSRLMTDDQHNTLEQDNSNNQQSDSKNISQKTSVLNSNRFSMNVSQMERTDLPPSPMLPTTTGQISHNLNPMVQGQRKVRDIIKNREHQNRTALNKPTQDRDEQLKIMGSSTRHLDSSQWESTNSPVRKSRSPQKKSQNTETGQEKMKKKDQGTSQITSFDSSAAHSPNPKMISSKTKFNNLKQDNTLAEINSLGESEDDTALKNNPSESQQNFEPMSVKFPRDQIPPTEETLDPRQQRSSLRKSPNKKKSTNLDIQQLISSDQEGIEIQAGYNIIQDTSGSSIRIQNSTQDNLRDTQQERK